MITELNGAESMPEFVLGLSYGEDSLQSYIVHGDSVEEVPKDNLTDAEIETLRDLEEEIERDIEQFWNVARCLLQIKTEKLYRGTHKTFDAYCRDKWDMTRVHANRLISFEKTVQTLKSEPVGTVAIPTNEAQARPLSGLDDENKKKVGKKVKSDHGDQASAQQWESARNQISPRKKRLDVVTPTEAPMDTKKIVQLPLEEQTVTVPLNEWNRLGTLWNAVRDMVEDETDHEDMLKPVEEALAIQERVEQASRRKEAA